MDLFQQAAPLVSQIGGQISGLFAPNRGGAPPSAPDAPAPMPDAPAAMAEPGPDVGAPPVTFGISPATFPPAASRAAQPGSDSPPTASFAPSAAQPAGFGSPPGFGPPPGGAFAPQPNYGQPPGFAQQPGYGQQPTHGQPWGYGAPFGYGQQPSGFGFPGGYPSPYGQPAPAFDQFGQLGQMFNALRQGQIPPLPAPYPQQPGGAGPGGPAAQPAFDATALLRMIVGNPQFQQALQSASRTVGLPVPYPGGVRTVQIPLGAAVSTVGRLAESALAELNASTGEDEPEIPEYLLNEEGEFIVDPAISDDRAALVAHLFKMSDQAPNQTGQADESNEADEAEAWAHDAGFADETTHWERRQ